MRKRASRSGSGRSARSGWSKVILIDTFREIKGSLSRFFSIFAIVALGVSFFTGIKATCPDMKITADTFFDDNRLMDLWLVSTAGFNDDDLAAIKSNDQIEGMMPTWSMDAVMDLDGQGSVVKVLALPLDKIKNPDESFLNRPVLLEGRFPERSDECLAERGKFRQSVSTGMKLTLSSGSDKSLGDSLDNTTYTVVGIVRSPYYISFERGTTALGNGKISSFIMVPEVNFKLPVHTDVFVTVKGARQLQCFSSEYDNLVEKAVKSMEAVGTDRTQKRYDEIVSEAETALSEKKSQMEAAARAGGGDMPSAQLSEAKRKIDEAQVEIDAVKKPEWYVLDRNANSGFVEYDQAADRMNAIARVFPVFFFLIAALVCLTTMTRMVDEQRTYIGTIKALGYGRGPIAFKYLFYAASASVLGSIAGLAIGFTLFPTVIFNAYEILFTMPPVILRFDPLYAGISTGFAVLTTLGATLFACYQEIIITPASLMRPKAPKPGKRIFLERIRFIWSRLNFTHKVTARNLLRYKKRFFMTIIGIGGCTALLLSGLGLRDSIMSIVGNQFNAIYRYQLSVGIKEAVTADKDQDVKALITSEGRITDSLLMFNKTVDIYYKDKSKSAILTVPEDWGRLPSFITLRNRITGEPVPLDGDGIIMTEKLAGQLGVRKGDEIVFQWGDHKTKPVKVGNITENYVYHYIYMPPELFESITGEEPAFQGFIAKTTSNESGFESKLSSDLLLNGKIASVSFTNDITSNFNNMIGSLNAIVLVLILSAAALSFVVLYNLTNINISERCREIATIKVLGFYNREVSAYVYRENLILTVIGMIIGLFLGIFLHLYVVSTAEVDMVMFGRIIKGASFINSVILTLLFSGLVNLVMYFRLRNIRMVESLKTIE